MAGFNLDILSIAGVYFIAQAIRNIHKPIKVIVEELMQLLAFLNKDTM